MPTYAYRCRDCGHQFDIFQKFSEDALTVCPACAGTIRRVIQPTGVVFKGTGFYINDSKSSSKSGPNKAGAAADGSGTSGGSDDSDPDRPGKTDAAADKPAAERTGTDKPASDKPASGPSEPAKAPAKAPAEKRTPTAARTSGR